MTDKPFKLKHNQKHDFIDWITDQFPSLQAYAFSDEPYTSLQDRLDEVHDAAKSVLDIVMKDSSEYMRKYYSGDLANLILAHSSNNVQDYARHLSSFVQVINIE